MCLPNNSTVIGKVELLIEITESTWAKHQWTNFQKLEFLHRLRIQLYSGVFSLSVVALGPARLKWYLKLDTRFYITIPRNLQGIPDRI